MVGHMIRSDLAVSLKLSSLLRSVMSSRFRFHRSSRADGVSFSPCSAVAVEGRSAWSDGTEGEPGTSPGACISSDASVFLCRGRGRIRLLLRALEISMTQWKSSLMSRCFLPCDAACSKGTGESAARDVDSTRHISFSSTLFFTRRQSSITEQGKFSSTIHTPAKAWPFVMTTRGFNPACSRQAAKKRVRSRQLPSLFSKSLSGRRTFCPFSSKLAGTVT